MEATLLSVLDSHIPTLCTHPFFILRTEELSAPDPDEYVSATSSEGEYPVNEEQYADTAQSEAERRHSAELFTIYDGKAHKYLEWFIGPVEGAVAGAKLRESLKRQMDNMKFAFASPALSAGRKGFVEEKLSIEILRRDLHNLGVDYSNLFHAGQYVQANAVRRVAKNLLLKTRQRCLDHIQWVQKDSGDGTRFYPGAPLRRCPPNLMPLVEPFVDRETTRIMAIHDAHRELPESFRAQADQIPDKLGAYWRDTLENRLKLWEDEQDFLDWVLLWLDFAKQSFDIRANLSVRPVREYLQHMFTAQAEAHAHQVASFGLLIRAQDVTGSNIYYRGIMEPRTQRSEVLKCIKHCETLAKAYRDSVAEKATNDAYWAARLLPDLGKFVVKPGSRRVGRTRTASKTHDKVSDGNAG